MKIIPLNGRILVEPIKQDTVSAGGIYIPEVADPNAKGLTKGRIVAISEEIDIRKPGMSVGKTVLFNKFSYTEIKLEAKAGETERKVLLIEAAKIEAYIDE
jgi:chaperonin GroES